MQDRDRNRHEIKTNVNLIQTLGIDPTDFGPILIQILEHGIWQALTENELTLIEQGYCFGCNTEKEVLEPAPHFPSQPPTCKECLIAKGLAFFSQTENLARLVESFTNNGTEGPE